MAATFWAALWLGSLVMALRMFQLKLPAPVTFVLAFVLWCILVASPVLGMAMLLGRTKEGLRLAGLLMLIGVLMGLWMAATFLQAMVTG
jgi:hypothetical protein